MLQLYTPLPLAAHESSIAVATEAFRAAAAMRAEATHDEALLFARSVALRAGELALLVVRQVRGTSLLC